MYMIIILDFKFESLSIYQKSELISKSINKGFKIKNYNYNINSNNNYYFYNKMV